MSEHRKEGMNMGCIGIVGTGFVADLYMRSLATFPDLRSRQGVRHQPSAPWSILHPLEYLCGAKPRTIAR